MSTAEDPKNLPLGDAVVNRAKENLAIAEIANSESLGNVDEVLVTQQQLVARKSIDDAIEAFDLARESVPLTKAAETKARLFERNSKVFKEGAEDWLAKIKTVAPEAAKNAAKEIMKQINVDAKAAAEKANEAAQDWKQKKAERVAANVAAAMQPYHLAMLRQQKGAAMTHAKAMGAMASAQSLADKAQNMAGQAQALQSAGDGISAQSMMMMAHGAMNAAANLKGQAERLYALSNKLNAGVGAWQVWEAKAANRAAITTLYNEPMKFPPIAPS